MWVLCVVFAVRLRRMDDPYLLPASSLAAARPQTVAAAQA